MKLIIKRKLIGDLLWSGYTKIVRGQKVTKWQVEDQKYPICNKCWAWPCSCDDNI